ncbi:hypothetical protein FSP39_009107 [Pinctada imbricata]|uniref:Uncharacterized protein n=1 Tax=Pinctada imbricata TaxID=66713 RepID=A0AA88YQI2_PINIB|nr:hypothetical protein FSP39_009107 [Pinctada imbricata]
MPRRFHFEDKALKLLQFINPVNKKTAPASTSVTALARRFTPSLSEETVHNETVDYILACDNELPSFESDRNLTQFWISLMNRTLPDGTKLNFGDTCFVFV